jgi:hypothetical protein
MQRKVIITLCYICILKKKKKKQANLYRSVSTPVSVIQVHAQGAWYLLPWWYWVLLQRTRDMRVRRRDRLVSGEAAVFGRT